MKAVSYYSKQLHHNEVINLNADTTVNHLHPFSFTASREGNETFHYHQAKQLDYRPEFVKEMIKELEDYTVRKH